MTGWNESLNEYFMQHQETKMSLQDRGESMMEILRLELQDGGDKYELDGNEMYLLCDYVKHLKVQIEQEHAMVRSLANALDGLLDQCPSGEPNSKLRIARVFASGILDQAIDR